MKKKIYLTLIGGLGNQLFQYACGINLSYELNAKLIIDDKTGFALDNIYNRKMGLPKKLMLHKTNFFQNIFLLILRAITKNFFRNKVYIKIFNLLIVDESNTNYYLEDFKLITSQFKYIYLIGFFQSEKYFIEHKVKINNRILNCMKNNSKINKLTKKIDFNSLMVGIRMYEEAPKNFRQQFGGIENFNFYNKSLKIFYKKYKKLKIFIFSTIPDKNYIYKKLNYPVNFFNIEKEKKLSDFETVIFCSNFKKFIISNSSFYWWAANLAKHKNNVKIIYSKKFINKSTVCTNRIHSL